MTIQSAIADMNHAILDLQSSDYNTFERPLKKLAKVLDSSELREINRKLKAAADFDDFLEKSSQGGGMMGSAKLNWPEDSEVELGLVLHLIERGANDPSWFMNFGHNWFYAGSKLIAGIHKMTGAVIVPFGRDYKKYVEANNSATFDMPVPSDRSRVFIVHGHDDAAREMVARFITNIGLEPIILHEQASKGMTIPEKLVAYSEVGFAVVLLTPDDLGHAKNDSDLQPRARQNVILELGYFIGRLTRARVCALLRDKIEIPSDYVGVVYTEFDDAGGWKMKLAQELQAAEYRVDWNKIMS